jgi:hypothetical protein
MTVAVASRVKDKVLDTKETVQVTADEVKKQVYQGTEALQTKAGEVASQVKGLTDQVREKVPAQVATRVEPLMATVKQRPLPIAAVAVVVLLVLRLVLQRLLRRNS